MWSHKGVAISITSNGDFNATIGEETLGSSSLVEIKKEIEKVLKGGPKGPFMKCACLALTREDDRALIVPVEVLGISGTDSSLKTQPPLNNSHRFHSSYELYPNHPEVAILLNELETHLNMAMELTEKLKPYLLPRNMGYGRKYLAEIPEACQKWEESYKRALEKLNAGKGETNSVPMRDEQPTNQGTGKKGSR